MKVIAKSILCALFCIVILPSEAFAEVSVIEHRYLDGKDHMTGAVVADSAWSGERPVVVVFHDWMGPSAETEQEAKRIAMLGYVVFIADVYGAGMRPTSVEDASKLSGMYKSQRNLMQQRARAALAQAISLPKVNRSKVAAIGYCFGGTVALELGRSGAGIMGIVSLHGGLDTPDTSMASNIRGRVLVLHGADDPFVPPAEVAAFENEMKAGNVKFEIVKYPGAVHAFTNAGVDALALKGTAYNAEADKQAFAAMSKFFSEIFDGVPL